MNKQQIVQKLTSRKFLMALISVITGILTMTGAEDVIVQAVTGVGLVLIPTITYIVTEGKIDAEGVKKIIDTAEQVIDVIDKIDDKKEDTSVVIPKEDLGKAVKSALDKIETPTI